LEFCLFGTTKRVGLSGAPVTAGQPSCDREIQYRVANFWFAIRSLSGDYRHDGRRWVETYLKTIFSCDAIGPFSTAKIPVERSREPKKLYIT
jgi:hypothetical protein